MSGSSEVCHFAEMPTDGVCLPLPLSLPLLSPLSLLLPLPLPFSLPLSLPSRCLIILSLPLSSSLNPLKGAAEVDDAGAEEVDG